MNEKLLKKIEKLLALSNSNYEGEADTALKMAYDLMNQNDISMEDIKVHSKDETLGKLGSGALDEEDKQYRKWEVSLLNAIAKMFDCQVLRTCYNNYFYRKSSLSIIGRESNRITTKLMYGWIHDKTMKEAKSLGGSLSTRRAYCVGVSNSISRKVDLLKAEAPKTDKWGLVPVDEVTNWIKTELGNINSLDWSAGSIEDGIAYARGVAAGEETSLNKQFNLNGIEYKGA